MNAIPFKNIKPMDMRKLYQGSYLPIIRADWRYNHNAGFPGVIRGIKSMSGKKLSVGSRNLYHGHSTPWPFPNGVHDLAVHIKEQAPLFFLRCHQKMFFSLVV